MSDLISRQAAIDALRTCYDTETIIMDNGDEYINYGDAVGEIEQLPSAEPEGYVKLPDSGIEDLSDGYHTFRQLYYQRMMLFAALVKQNKDKAWKSYRHEDGELCFGGGWFIVGIDTPEGSYTYHYEAKYYSIFDCKELEYAKHWDGHTEVDVTRLLSLPSAEPDRLTDDDFETIRIHLNAYKEQLCNQHRWEEAEEYQRIIDRFIAFASAQPQNIARDIATIIENEKDMRVMLQQRWIPCSERLPEEREWYLGIFKEPDTGWINPLPFICEYLLGKKTKATTKEGWILRDLRIGKNILIIISIWNV